MRIRIFILRYANPDPGHAYRVQFLYFAWNKKKVPYAFVMLSKDLLYNFFFIFLIF